VKLAAAAAPPPADALAPVNAPWPGGEEANDGWGALEDAAPRAVVVADLESPPPDAGEMSELLNMLGVNH
jgi:hypothetical protein